MKIARKSGNSSIFLVFYSYFCSRRRRSIPRANIARANIVVSPTPASGVVLASFIPLTILFH
jgi:hypothetical protein